MVRRKKLPTRNPSLVEEEEIAVPLLPGEEPPKNPNTQSGLFFGKTKQHKTWLRSDGVREQRVQVYLPVSLARAMRNYCASVQPDGMSHSEFMKLAVSEQLKKVGVPF